MHGFDLHSNNNLWKQCFETEGYAQVAFASNATLSVDSLVAINVTTVYGISTQTGVVEWKNSTYQNLRTVWVDPAAKCGILDVQEKLIEIDAQSGILTGKHLPLILTSWPSVSVNMAHKKAAQVISSETNITIYVYDLSLFTTLGSCTLKYVSIGQYGVFGSSFLFISENFLASIDLNTCQYIWQNSSMTTISFVAEGNYYWALRTDDQSKSWMEYGSITNGPLTTYSIPNSFQFAVDVDAGFYAVGFQRYNKVSCYHRGEHKGDVEGVSSMVAACASDECFMVAESANGNAKSYSYEL